MKDENLSVRFAVLPLLTNWFAVHVHCVHWCTLVHSKGLIPQFRCRRGLVHTNTDHIHTRGDIK